MSDAIRIWSVEGDALAEIDRSSLDLEARLETWMLSDVSVLSDDLLVIGSQLDTKGHGVLDLLCLDQRGDVVIVELKRAKTPREVTAQALDYGAWAVTLSAEDIQAFGDERYRDAGGLADAFRQRFDKGLPDVLNNEHHLLIVGSEIDDRTERVIRYLSETHGVSVNAVTFNYFQAADGRELLARTHLIEPDAVEERTARKPGNKRRRDATLEDHREEAERLGVSDLFNRLTEGMSQWFNTWAGQTVVSFGRRGKWLVMLRILTSKSEPGSLRFDSLEDRLGQAFGLPPSEVRALFPSDVWPLGLSTSTSAPADEWEGYEGVFRDVAEIDRFLAGLSTAPRQPVN